MQSAPVAALAKLVELKKKENRPSRRRHDRRILRSQSHAQGSSVLVARQADSASDQKKVPLILGDHDFSDRARGRGRKVGHRRRRGDRE